MIPFIATMILQTQAPATIPTFKLPASDNLTYSPSALTKKPTIIVFLTETCPHNPKALPHFIKLRKALPKTISVIGFINAPHPQARTFAKSYKLNFPLISDPKATTMLKFGATHSLDLALTLPQSNQIKTLSNGYNREIIANLLSQIPNSPKIDLSEFPAALQSGCGF